jgi:hypothetical protein
MEAPIGATKKLSLLMALVLVGCMSVEERARYEYLQRSWEYSLDRGLPGDEGHFRWSSVNSDGLYYSANADAYHFTTSEGPGIYREDYVLLTVSPRYDANPDTLHPGLTFVNFDVRFVTDILGRDHPERPEFRVQTVSKEAIPLSDYVDVEIEGQLFRVAGGCRGPEMREEGIWATLLTGTVPFEVIDAASRHLVSVSESAAVFESPHWQRSSRDRIDEAAVVRLYTDRGDITITLTYKFVAWAKELSVLEKEQPGQ